jgi:hypothetical protein
MRDATVIRCCLQVGIFLFSLLSCAYVLFRKTSSAPAVAGLGAGSKLPEVRPLAILFLSSQGSSSPLSPPHADGAGKLSPKGGSSALADWLAPVIVWILVLLMAMGIVGFLLGEK